MRIGIASDLHLGARSRDVEVLYTDNFANARKGIDILRKESDVILIGGDLFDDSNPDTETLAETIRILKRAKEVPVVAIHGNHDIIGERGRENILHVLEEAGLLTYLHGKRWERDGVVVTGVGWQAACRRRGFFRKVAEEFPPIPGKFNILLTHFDLKEFIAGAEGGWGDLPQGYDLYVNGHIHTPYYRGNRLIPGSLGIYRLDPREFFEKRVYVYDTGKKELEEFPIPGQRKYHYIVVELKGGRRKEIKRGIEEGIRDVEEGSVVVVELRGVVDAPVVKGWVEEILKERGVYGTVRDRTRSRLREEVERVEREIRELGREVSFETFVRLVEERMGAEYGGVVRAVMGEGRREERVERAVKILEEIVAREGEAKGGEERKEEERKGKGSRGRTLFDFV